jgi:hypothetical protein
MGWILMLLLVLLPIFFGTSRIIQRLDDMEQEELWQVRQRATSRSSQWYICAWAALLLITGVVGLLRGSVVGASVVLVVSAVLFAAALVLTHRNRKLLEALGDRGTIARTDRYHQRDRHSAAWGALALVGWFIGNLSDVLLERRDDDVTWLQATGGTVLVIGVLGWLTIRVRMYLAGDDLDEPTEADRDGRTATDA